MIKALKVAEMYSNTQVDTENYYGLYGYIYHILYMYTIIVPF